MGWLWRRSTEQDLERELRTHLELEAAEQRANGLSDEEAHYAARRAFGNVTRVKEQVREVYGWLWIDACLQDLRFGIRMLVKARVLTVAVAVSLALGAGASTGMFSLLNSLAFRRLPVPDPEALVALEHGGASEQKDTFTYPQFSELRNAVAAVDLFGFADGGRMRLRAAGVDRMVASQFVSGNYYHALQLRPHAGRLLAASDDVRGSESATSAVISYRLWKGLPGNEGVVGRTILLDSVQFAVVGVMPQGFCGVEVGKCTDVVVPLASKPLLAPQLALLDCAGCYWLHMMGRLRRGFTKDSAEAALGTVWGRLRSDARAGDDLVHVSPGGTGLSALRERFARPLRVLLAMSVLILLISCVNVASLMMARLRARQGELAVRLSIGARRGRIVRQLLVESALLALASVPGSVVVHLLIVTGLQRYLGGGEQPVYLSTSADSRIALFVSGVFLAALVVFGLIPAVGATRARLSASLAGTARPVGVHKSFNRAILCGQVALTLALLAAATLMGQSVYRLRGFDAGFRRDHVLLVSPDASRAIPDSRDQLRYVEGALSEIRALPGVRSASASVITPIEGASWRSGFTVPGHVGARDEDYGAFENMVTPHFFRTMGTPILAGRDFTEQDDERAPWVAVINESFSRRYWPGRNPVGQHFQRVGGKPLFRVVGVVKDAKYLDLREAAPPTVYWPVRQSPPPPGWSLGVEVWTDGAPLSVAPAVRDVLTHQGRDVPVRVRTFRDLIDERLLQERLLTVLSVCFAAVALAVCAVGIYGLAAYGVSRRTAEIGLRMAIGATPGSVIALILREQMLVVCAGLAGGVIGSLAIGRALRTWLFGVSPTDIPTLIAGLVCLAGTALVATAIPARRAAGVEMVAALRHD